MDNPSLARPNWRLFLRVAGAGLLIATASIHLDLYLTGYRSIPTIGWLFLFQVIASFALGSLVLARDNRFAFATGALLAASTLGGYLLSLRITLFGFREVRTTVGIVAGIIEVGAFGVLAALALGAPGRAESSPPLTSHPKLLYRLESGYPGAWRPIGALSVVAAVLLALSVAATHPTKTISATTVLKTTKIHGVTVLTNAGGYTLYWFAPDTPTTSVCNGTCAAYWPPTIGSQSAGSGVTGTLGTVKRSDGSIEATYNGHPLYTYVGDSAPGQNTGNNINLNGGLWHEMTPSG
jgi:predicted lipoprotein with Yx(FWY)xxD motif